MKKMTVAGVPPIVPIPLDPPTSIEPEEHSTPPAYVVASLRNKLLERLESERKLAVGAASVEPGVEPAIRNISEDSLS